MVKGYIAERPDCEWGYRLPNLGEYRIDMCYAKFREHCVERRDLRETEVNAGMFLDPEAWTLMLFKDA